MSILSRNIINARNAKGITRKQLQMNSGLSAGNMSGYENGRIETQLKTLLILSRTLNVSPAEMLKENPDFDKPFESFDDYTEAVSDRIAVFKMTNRLTTQKLATMTGISHNRLKSILNGEFVNVRMTMLKSLANLIGIPVYKMLEN